MALDPNAISERVRFLLGNPSEAILPEEILLQIINECIAEIGDDDELYCEVVQCSLMNTLRYLIRQSQIPSSPNGGTVKRRKERRGRTEIEEEYQSGSSVTNGWQDMYDDYLQHPEWICDSLAPDLTNRNFGKVTIGGVRKDIVKGIKKDPNSNTAYDKPRVLRKFRPAYRNTRLR